MEFTAIERFAANSSYRGISTSDWPVFFNSQTPQSLQIWSRVSLKLRHKKKARNKNVGILSRMPASKIYCLSLIGRDFSSRM
jgi:hypothetical protein